MFRTTNTEYDESKKKKKQESKPQENRKFARNLGPIFQWSSKPGECNSNQVILSPFLYNGSSGKLASRLSIATIHTHLHAPTHIHRKKGDTRMAQVNFLSREKFGARKDLLPAAKGWNIESLGARRERNVTRIFLLRSFLPLPSAILTYEHRVWIAMALVIRASTYSYLTLWQLVPPSLLPCDREREEEKRVVYRSLDRDPADGSRAIMVEGFRRRGIPIFFLTFFTLGSDTSLYSFLACFK